MLIQTNCLPAFSLSLFLCFPFKLLFLSIFIHFNLIYSISLHFNLIISQLTVQINFQFNSIVCSIQLSVETKWQFNSNESNTFIAQPKHQQQHNRKANTNTNVNSSATFFIPFICCPLNVRKTDHKLTECLLNFNLIISNQHFHTKTKANSIAKARSTTTQRLHRITYFLGGSLAII